MELGDNLTTYPNLETLSAKTAESLRALLVQIRLPYKILSVWSDGKKHYCLLTSSRKLKIIKEN